MPFSTALFLSVLIIMMLIFSFFAFFNLMYGLASLWQPKIHRVRHSKKQVAVVIVSYNEEYVLEDTIRACERLSYSNKLIVLADDSSDPQIVGKLRHLAISKGCQKKINHQFFQEMEPDLDPFNKETIEIWESENFVFFHRPKNIGFKSGSLKKIHEYLKDRNIDLMYLLDADWHPQKDALERTLEVLEADDKNAFVQTKRISFPKGMNLFQKYITIIEGGLLPC